MNIHKLYPTCGGNNRKLHIYGITPNISNTANPDDISNTINSLLDGRKQDNEIPVFLNIYPGCGKDISHGIVEVAITSEPNRSHSLIEERIKKIMEELLVKMDDIVLFFAESKKHRNRGCNPQVCQK